VTNWICDDLGSLLRLRRLTAVSDWKGHGGITSVVTAEWRPGCRSRA
jgi:7-cyano-7-deazaguanine reductase